MRIFRSDKKWPRFKWWKRSSFATERFQGKFVTFIGSSVGGILCETNEHSKSEIESNRQTHRPMKSTDVQTLGAL